MAKSSLIHHYARQGALARLTELTAELAEIERAFPDLGGRTGSGPARPAAPAFAPATPARRRRRSMTAAQRKAVGERMRRYWAARRKAGTKKT